MKPKPKKQLRKIVQDADQTGVTEGARRATGVPPVVDHPDPEVSEKRNRRKFTAKYKLEVLAEADSCTKSGQVGALLRREGLYFSNLAAWRNQRDKGLLYAMAPKKRGRKEKDKNPLIQKSARLERENERLRKKLKQTEIIIDVQKKLSEILGIQLPPPPEEKE